MNSKSSYNPLTYQDIKSSSVTTTTTEGAEIAHPIDIPIASGSAFARFAKLPAELQLLVWEFAITDLPARVVAVDVQLEEGFSHPRLHHDSSEQHQVRASIEPGLAALRILKCSSRTRLPGLLQSCTTARRLGMKDYTVEIKSKSRIIRLDGNNDTLFLFSLRNRREAGNIVTRPGFDNLRMLMGKQQTLGQSGEKIDFVIKGVKRLAVCDPVGYAEYSSRVERTLNGNFHLRDAFPDLQECLEIGGTIRVQQLQRVMTYLQNTDEEVRFIERKV